jgi:hypothetical protein
MRLLIVLLRVLYRGDGLRLGVLLDTLSVISAVIREGEKGAHGRFSLL